MIKTKAEPPTLTPRERACIEHVQAAQKQQISFAQYCRENGLTPNQWHWVKHALVRKGVLSPSRKPEQSPVPRPMGFAPVRLASPVNPGEVVCRIRHPLGWTIECVSWPQPSWLSQLLTGERP